MTRLANCCISVGASSAMRASTGLYEGMTQTLQLQIAKRILRGTLG
jgi:hypothetical protein